MPRSGRPPTSAPLDLKAGRRGKAPSRPTQWVTCDYKEQKQQRPLAQVRVRDEPGPRGEGQVRPAQRRGLRRGAGHAAVLGPGLPRRPDVSRARPLPWLSRGPQAQPGNGRRGRWCSTPRPSSESCRGGPCETRTDSGWTWSELEDDRPRSASRRARAARWAEAAGGVRPAHRQQGRKPAPALPERRGDRDGPAAASPVLMVNDLGLTFGHAGLLTGTRTA